MIKNIIFLIISLILISLTYFLVMNDFVILTQTENGIVFGKPAYEKRSIVVSKTDLMIVREVKSLVSSRQHWAKNAERQCNNLAPYNLYCALEAASIKIDGKYVHRRPALQEVRFAIDDLYRNRWKIHRLADFNNHEDTTHRDILSVLNLAISRIHQKLDQ